MDRSITSEETKPPIFALALQPEFPINAFILASEALRIANQNSGRHIFECLVVAEAGKPVRASNGMWITPDGDLRDLGRVDFVLLFGGNLPTQRNSPQLLAGLRAAHRFGSKVIGIDTGAFAIAQAGISAASKVTVHWEAATAYVERFPEAAVEDCLFVVDGKSGGCAGGIATLDLMLELIAGLRGRALANEVAYALVHTARDGERRQRSDEAAERTAPSFQRQLISVMEQNLDFPLPPRELAGHLRLSLRTLERRCARHFGQSPAQLYLKVRLQAARNLLFYEDRSVKEIADACGFSYPSAFTRAFSKVFGMPPRQFRESFRATQDHAMRPEIRRLATRQSGRA
jgi:AraC family carnitine catabolism transcriptional activator